MKNQNTTKKMTGPDSFHLPPLGRVFFVLIVFLYDVKENDRENDTKHCRYIKHLENICGLSPSVFFGCWQFSLFDLETSWSYRGFGVRRLKWILSKLIWCSKNDNETPGFWFCGGCITRSWNFLARYHQFMMGKPARYSQELRTIGNKLCHFNVSWPGHCRSDVAKCDVRNAELGWSLAGYFSWDLELSVSA